MSSTSRGRIPPLLAAGLLFLSAACGEAPPAERDTAVASEPVASGEMAAENGPPLGRYVCRQYTTTMGYVTLEAGETYEVSGVRGKYHFDPQTGAMQWEGGSYDEWNWSGTYEHVTRPEGDGRPDEDIIRLVSEADGLKIDCYKMSEG